MQRPDLAIKLAGGPSPPDLADPYGGASDQHAKNHQNEDEHEKRQRRRIGRTCRREWIKRNRHRLPVSDRKDDNDYRQRQDNQHRNDSAEHLLISPSEMSMAGTNPAITIAFRQSKEPEALYRFRSVEPLAHFLARFEKRHRLFVDRHMGAGTRVPPRTGRPMLDREGAEAAQFDPVALRHCGGDLAKDGVDDVLNVALIKMGILACNTLNEF